MDVQRELAFIQVCLKFTLRAAESEKNNSIGDFFLAQAARLEQEMAQIEMSLEGIQADLDLKAKPVRKSRKPKIIVKRKSKRV